MGVALCLTLVFFVSSSHAQNDVWVDLAYPGFEQGSQVAPYDTLGDALVDVSAGGTIHFTAGDSHEAITIDQSVTIDAIGGTVRLGILSSVYGSGAPLEWLRITEIMYNPASGGAEFLELQNTGSVAIEVSGVYFGVGITFTFPQSTTLASGERFVLVRDSDQSAFNSMYGASIDGLYSGGLSNSGETLTLRTANHLEFYSLTYNDSGTWPYLADGQGYSMEIIDPDSDGNSPDNWGASSDSGGSPGSAGSNPPVLSVGDTEFSVDRGFYETPFSLAISSDTSNATIRYTLNGSTPSTTSGSIYSTPISISATTVVRAIAYKSGWVSTNVDTQTYLFIDDIASQSETDATNAGWPAAGVENWDIDLQVMDYEMDPDIVNHASFSGLIDDALLSIPSISLVTDLPNLVDQNTGIYENAVGQGINWERPASIELINPDGSILLPNEARGFQINAGLRMRGGTSRGSWNPKHSFRLFFRTEYGAGKLDYPLFGDEGPDEYDKIDFRTSQQYSWHQGGDGSAVFNRDVFNRDTQRDMGQPYTRSRYYHLYLNGLYWGLFQTQERAEARYAASHMGGVKEDYDVVKVNSGAGNPYTVEATDGVLTTWYNIWSEANAGLEATADYNFVQGLNPDGSPNAGYAKMLDMDNLIDYMLIIFYGGNLDAPIMVWGGDNVPNNFYSMYNRTNPDGFKHFIHDAEHTLLTGNAAGQGGDELYRDRTGPYPAGNNQAHSNPQWIHQQLVANPEYKMRFADRVHRYFFNNGLLTSSNNIARFNSRADEIELAVIAESARWGDAANTTYWNVNPPLNRNDWYNATNNIRNNYFPFRTGIVLSQFESKGWYPSTDAPYFNINGSPQHGGTITSPRSLTMTNPNGSGTIYYTMDGPDPRDPAVAQVGSPTTILQENASKTVLVPTGSGDLSDGSYNWKHANFNDSTWTSGTGGVGYDTATTYDSLIDIDVQSGMLNTNGTVLIRIPFTLTAQQVADASCMTLRIKYDDGFVANLNASEVLRVNKNAGGLNWNTLADTDHPDAAALQYVEFDLDDHAVKLVTGANVLAIQGLNRAIDSSDFLISVELEISGCQDFVAPVAAGALTYSTAILLTETVHVKSRVLNDDEWSALNEATYVHHDFTNDLRVTEIMYNPVNPDAEFIELKNVGSEALNLTDTRFTEGIHFTFPDFTLAVGAYVLVVKDETIFDSVYGSGKPVAGEYSGSLDNGGERIRLEDPTGATILDFEYKDGWFDITDGGGYSLTIVNPSGSDSTLWSQSDGWRASATAGGSVGTNDSGVEPNPGSVKINEVLAHSDNADPDWIELYNPTASSIDIGGWFLSDNDLDLQKYTIAAGTTIAAGGYKVFYEDTDFADPSDPGSNTVFALSENGETVYLSSGSGGSLTGYREQEDFGASLRDVSIGRHLKSTGTYNFVAMSSDTPGSANAYPKVGPVVIRKIMYRPASVDLEFIELRNKTGSAVDLFDADGNPWIFSEGITYTLPPNTTIPANGHLLVAKDPTALAANHTIPGGVEVVGPYVGALNNGGEKLEIAMPGDVNGSGELQYIRVDRVVYDNVAPWPTGPDGGGNSLKRANLSNYGNDVVNWNGGSAPTPGS
jgi:hypothetical protein